MSTKQLATLIGLLGNAAKQVYLPGADEQSAEWLAFRAAIHHAICILESTAEQEQANDNA